MGQNRTFTDPPKPTKLGIWKQMDPGQKDFRHYTFKDGTNVVLAHVLVTRTQGRIDGVAYDALREYWCDVSSAPPAHSITVSWFDCFWDGRGWDRTVPRPAVRSFMMDQVAAWSSARGVSLSAGPQRFVHRTVVIDWRIEQDARGAWTGQLDWFNLTGQSDVFRDATSPVTLSAYVQPHSPPDGWHQASVVPF